MFGGLVHPPKPHLKPRPVPQTKDVWGIQPYHTGVIAREPATDYDIKMMQYEQRKQEFADRKRENLGKIINADKIEAKVMKHAEKRGFQRDIRVRVNKKMKEYEDTIVARREKLREIFWKEEREFIREAIDQAQKGEEWRIEQIKLRIHELRERREAERMEIVEQKKLQQYFNNIDDFRPVIKQRHIVECSEGQLQQIRERENRKECEKELDRMWYKMMMRELDAKTERHDYGVMVRRHEIESNKNIWDVQMQEKEARYQEEQREKREELLQMERLKEERLREETKELDEKRRKRDKILRDLKDQMKEKVDLLKIREDEELAVIRAYEQLAIEELEKDKKKASESASGARKEMQQFREYLKQLEQERKDEEKLLDEIVAQERSKLEDRKEEAYCKLAIARQALKEETFKGLAEQVEYKKQEAQQQLNLKKAENQLIQLAYEQNDRLRAEYARQQILASQQYREDLRKQVEYTKTLREREKDELERQLAAGKVEEEKYQVILSQLINSGEAQIGIHHPFKRALRKEKCVCPPVCLKMN